MTSKTEIEGKPHTPSATVTMTLPQLCAQLGWKTSVSNARYISGILQVLVNGSWIKLISVGDKIEMDYWTCCECDECGWEGNSNEECQKGCPKHSKSYNELGYKPLLATQKSSGTSDAPNSVEFAVVKAIRLVERCENSDGCEDKTMKCYKPVQMVELEVE